MNTGSPDTMSAVSEVHTWTTLKHLDCDLSLLNTHCTIEILQLSPLSIFSLYLLAEFILSIQVHLET